ncbi:hypothetical protein ACV36R_32280, partial [Pseudomonas aeruginosa]
IDIAFCSFRFLKHSALHFDTCLLSVDHGAICVADHGKKTAVTQVFAGALALYIWLLGETNHSRKRQFDSTSICFNGSTGAYRNNTLRM